MLQGSGLAASFAALVERSGWSFDNKKRL